MPRPRVAAEQSLLRGGEAVLRREWEELPVRGIVPLSLVLGLPQFCEWDGFSADFSGAVLAGVVYRAAELRNAVGAVLSDGAGGVLS